MLHFVPSAQICKRLRSPGINSNESIPPAYVAWRAYTTKIGLWYWPARLQVSRIDFLLESIPSLFMFTNSGCVTIVSLLIFWISYTCLLHPFMFNFFILYSFLFFILSNLFLFLFLASLILLALHSLQYFFLFISKVATLLFLLIFYYKLCLHSSNTIINLLFTSRNIFQMQLSVVGLINDFI